MYFVIGDNNVIKRVKKNYLNLIITKFNKQEKYQNRINSRLELFNFIKYL